MKTIYSEVKNNILAKTLEYKLQSAVIKSTLSFYSSLEDEYHQ